MASSLRLDRADTPDCTVCQGIQTHYHYRYISNDGASGKLKIRWLSCPCVHCLDRDWDKCVNKAWVGTFHDREVEQIGRAGETARKQRNNVESDKMADELKGGETVAIFCHKKEDLRGNRFWLAKAVGEPWTVQETVAECPVSGDEFDYGERVMKVQYYDRVGSSPSVFRFRPELGTFMVRTNMLRQ